MAKLVLIVLLTMPSMSISNAQNLRASRIRNRHVRYIPSEKLKQYPIPPIIFERGGLAKKIDQNEIIEKIVYPVINNSTRPVAAVVIELYPDKPSIGVTIIWHGIDPTGAVNFSSALIDRNNAGHFDANAYKVFFEEID